MEHQSRKQKAESRKQKLAAWMTVAIIALGAVQASAQQILGRHPADTVLPQLFQQNSNAETMVRGINQAKVAVTNLDLSATAQPPGWGGSGGGGTNSPTFAQATNIAQAVAASAAQNSTNNLGTAAFTAASAYDAAGRAQNATNGLGTAAFTSALAYDISGAAQNSTNGYPWSNLYDVALAAQKATNNLGSAAFTASSNYDNIGAASLAAAAGISYATTATNTLATNLLSIVQTNQPYASAFFATNGITDLGQQRDINGYLGTYNSAGILSSMVDSAIFYPRFNPALSNSLAGGKAALVNPLFVNSNGLSFYWTNGYTLHTANTSTNFQVSITMIGDPFERSAASPPFNEGIAQLVFSYTATNGEGIYVHTDSGSQIDVNSLKGNSWAWGFGAGSNSLIQTDLGGVVLGHGFNFWGQKFTLTIARTNGLYYAWYNGLPIYFGSSALASNLCALQGESTLPPTILRIGMDTNFNNATIVGNGSSGHNTNIDGCTVSSVAVFTNGTPAAVAAASYTAAFWPDPNETVYFLDGESLWDPMWQAGSYQPYYNNPGTALQLKQPSDWVFNYSHAGTRLDYITNYNNASYPQLVTQYPNGWPMTTLSLIPYPAKVKFINIFTILGRNDVNDVGGQVFAVAKYNNFYNPRRALGARIIYVASPAIWTNGNGWSQNFATNLANYHLTQASNTVNSGYVPWYYFVSQDMMNTNLLSDGSLPFSGDGTHFIDGPGNWNGTVQASDGWAVNLATAGLLLGQPWSIDLHARVRTPTVVSAVGDAAALTGTFYGNAPGAPNTWAAVWTNGSSLTVTGNTFVTIWQTNIPPGTYTLIGFLDTWGSGVNGSIERITFANTIAGAGMICGTSSTAGNTTTYNYPWTAGSYAGASPSGWSQYEYFRNELSFTSATTNTVYLQVADQSTGVTTIQPGSQIVIRSP